ncbi:MAG: hypothetical protein IT182_19515 [Acidobacteria bacterium]|nr:hypothetical protein [Acidobacteriota bacterium]
MAAIDRTANRCGHPQGIPCDPPATLTSAQAAERVDGEKATLSFWDAMVVHAAAELGCQVLWPEDLNDGQVVDGVRIRNPFAQIES